MVKVNTSLTKTKGVANHCRIESLSINLQLHN